MQPQPKMGKYIVMGWNENMEARQFVGRCAERLMFKILKALEPKDLLVLNY